MRLARVWHLAKFSRRPPVALYLSLSSRPRIPGGGGSTRPQLPQPPPYNSIHYIAARSRTDRGCTAQSVSGVSDRGCCSRCRFRQPHDCVVVGFASSRFSPRLQILSTGTCRQRGSHSLTHSRPVAGHNHRKKPETTYLLFIETAMLISRRCSRVFCVALDTK